MNLKSNMINKSILVISGPNLNLLGNREEKYYGNIPLDEIYGKIKKIAHSNNITIECKQSNSESEIIEWIQNAKNSFKAIIINAGGYTHTSVSIRDSLKLFDGLIIEIHMSNVHSREDFRHTSLISGVSNGIIIGFGEQSYYLAVNAAIDKIKGGKNYG